ncbi:hypothetical protein JCM10908_003877 [Rhodotorula pacifica]|uniref:uncharacterized protein n=1 Tax=Rhodotorula pacifica TaxID=1495444 RepID=UPI0031757186
MAPNPYLKAIAPDAAKKAAAAANPAAINKSSPNKGKAKSNGAAAATARPRSQEDEELRQEILALGGDAADLELLAGVESDSELEGDDDEAAGAGKSTDTAGLFKDLRSFVKGLDFKAAGATQPADDSEDEEGVADDAEGEDSDDQEEEDEEPAPAPAPAPVKESKAEREARRRLEREAEKEAEQREKELQRANKEEKKQAKLGDMTKSPWIVDPTPHWYAVPTVSPLATATARPKPELISAMHARGQTLLTKENELYSTSLDPKGTKSGAAPPPNGLSKSDQVFIQQILASGTSSDRISALVLLVSSSPLHTTSFLDQLAGLCRKKSRDESLRAMRSLVTWWCSEGGGAPTRKLRYFADQPLLPTVAAAYEALDKKGKHAIEVYEGMSKADVERCLVLFTFEDWLKRWFFQILQSLEQMSVDPLPHPRTQAVMHLSSMLRDKPEQESNILRLLVNKLGDTNRAIASKTSHHLLQVLQSHPGMTPILVREVAALVLRPRASVIASAPAASTSHVRFGDDESAGKGKSSAASAAPVKDHARDNARYYGVTTLNQVMLTKEQGEVAAKMVDVYFEVFSDVLGRLPDVDEHQKASGDEGAAAAPKGKKRARDEGKKAGKKGGKGGKQAVEHDDAVNDVDSKLVAAVLTGINRAFPYAKLDDAAFKQRLDTLFRITHQSTFNVSIQALLLIFRVTSNKQEMADRFYRALYASMHDARLAHSSKQALYLNLVFRATKQDKDANRVAAFVKRLIQLLANMDTTFVLGGLFVVGELLATVRGLRTLISVPEKVKLDAVKESQGKLAEKDRDSHATDSYDGRKRDPKYAHAENSCLWELVPLLSHWHPTVVQYADAVLSGDAISASSDLEQYSLMSFLDRFIYREAKKTTASRGSSMMQPGLANQDRSNRVVLVKGSAAAAEAVNSDKFRRKNVHDVAADQLFFHKFFTSKAELDGGKATAATKRKARRGGRGSDDEDDASDAGSIVEAGGDIDGGFDDDEFAAAMAETGEPDAEADGDEVETDEEMEEEIWKAMKKSMPKAKGDSDMEDLEAGDDEDDDDDVAMYHYSESEEEEEGGATKEAEDDDDDDEAEPPFKSAFEDSDIGEDDPGFLELDDDVLGSDEDIELDGADDDEDDEEAAAPGKKDNKKRKLKHLPTFASADDYAHLLGGSDDEDI